VLHSKGGTADGSEKGQVLLRRYEQESVQMHGDRQTMLHDTTSLPMLQIAACSEEGCWQTNQNGICPIIPSIILYKYNIVY
jgi:hypothetical protein